MISSHSTVLSLTPPLCSSISLTSSHPTLCRLFLYISNFMPPYCSLYYSTPVLLYMSHIVPPYCVQAWKDPTGAGLGGRWHPGRRLLHPPRDKYPPPGRFKKMMNSSFSSYYVSWGKTASTARNYRKLCLPNRSDDLCLVFCINPSSMLKSHRNVQN